MILQPVIVLDSDGVFADFHGKMKQMGVTNSDKHFWATMSTVPNLFLHLDMIPDAMVLYDGIKHLRHYVLTAQPKPTGHFNTARDDKILWWQTKVNPKVQVVVVNSGKAKALHAAPNKVLIDDLPRNINLWKEAGGIGILHTSAHETLKELRNLAII